MTETTSAGAHLIEQVMSAATGYVKQRSPSELTAWLGDVGFKRFEHHFLPSPRDVFLAWKS